MKSNQLLVRKCIIFFALLILISILCLRNYAYDFMQYAGIISNEINVIVDNKNHLIKHVNVYALYEKDFYKTKSVYHVDPIDTLLVYSNYSPYSKLPDLYGPIRFIAIVDGQKIDNIGFYKYCYWKKYKLDLFISSENKKTIVTWSISNRYEKYKGVEMAKY